MVSKISILIAAYKAEKWLRESIESALSQVLDAGTSIEVLIGVDCCEKTMEVARQFASDPRVGILEFDTNEGAYSTVNALLSYATGDAVVRFDADDMMLPSRIAKMVAMLNSNPLVDLVGTYYIKTDEFLSSRKPVNNHTCGSWMLRREAMDRLGGYENWRFGADDDLLNRAKAMGMHQGLVEENLYLYRGVPTSLTNCKETGFRSHERRINIARLISDRTEFASGMKIPKCIVSKCRPFKTALGILSNREHQVTFVKPTFHAWFPTYNRPELCLDLLHDLEQEAETHSLVVTVHDDGSTADYSACRAIIDAHPGWEFIEHQHGGKQNFWKLISEAHQDLKFSDAQYFVQLADDFRLCKNFLTRCLDAWNKIDDPSKIALNPMFDEARINDACWTSLKPVSIEGAGLRRTGWLDCTQFSEKTYYESLGYICPDTSRRSPEGRGSGVGRAISMYLAAADLHVYQIEQSLVVHRLTNSRMNHRISTPQKVYKVMSKNFIDGADDARRLLYLDPVTASLASIPGRAHMLPATIASLLPQVDRINVMLNEYDHVPDCLNHPKIVVERSQNVGNFYSDAMFWWVDEVKGYHFFCADDLVYHPDYVASMIPWIEWYERKTTLTCHAVIIDPDPKDYYRCRKVYHGMTPSSEAHWCNVGCIAYHTDTLKLTRQQMCLREVSDPREHNMSDIIIAIEHQKQRVPCLGIARNFQPYSMPIHDVGIYEHSRSRDKSVWDSADIQTKAVQGFGKWELFTIDEMLNPHDAQNQFEDPMAVVESTYWSRRYRDGGNSGKGSYGEEAAFKSDTIASIAAKFEVQSVVDFGIGDGSMVSNIQRKLKPNTQYLGFDISPVAVNAIKRTNHDGVFEVGDVASGSIEAHADMALCIDVFFHLMSAERQTKAMETICNSFGKVAIVSALNQKPAEPMAAHCSYWPMKIPEGIRLVEEIVLPMNPKLSLYVLSR